MPHHPTHLAISLRYWNAQPWIDLVMAHLGITVTDSIDFIEIDELVLQGKKVQALERYRDQDRAAGLAEAKNIIEERAPTVNRIRTDPSTPGAKGSVASNSTQLRSTSLTFAAPTASPIVSRTWAGTSAFTRSTTVAPS
jgi:hypothetical protein